MGATNWATVHARSPRGNLGTPGQGSQARANRLQRKISIDGAAAWWSWCVLRAWKTGLTVRRVQKMGLFLGISVPFGLPPTLKINTASSARMYQDQEVTCPDALVRDLQTHHMRGGGAIKPRFQGHMTVAEADVGIASVAQGKIIINRII